MRRTCQDSLQRCVTPGWAGGTFAEQGIQPQSLPTGGRTVIHDIM